MRALKMTVKMTVAALTASILAVPVGMAAPAGATVESVAIIVIDNFGELPETPEKLTPQSNCAYAPEDTNVVGDHGAGDDLPAGVSHGTAVRSRLSAELDATPGLTGMPPSNDLRNYGLDGMTGVRQEVQRWAYEAQEVVLFGMETNGYTTLTLAGRIRAVKDALRLSTSGITRVVLNMSFVIVPCNVPAWLKTFDQFDAERTLASYHALLAVHPELGDLDGELADFPTDPARREARLLHPAPDDPLMPLRVLAAPAEFYGLADPGNYHLPHQLAQRLNSDPLKALLFAPATSGPVVPVAAAGNGLRVFDGADKLVRLRFTFPFAPALWDPVVAVSGGVDQYTRADYSNNGEVVLEGTTEVDGPDGVANVHGSSFAAPRLSASVATYLLTGGPSPCEGHLPVLGYTNSEWSGQHWDDLSLLAAAKRFCDPYLSHTSL